MHISLSSAKELKEFLTVSQFFSMSAISQPTVVTKKIREIKQLIATVITFENFRIFATFDQKTIRSSPDKQKRN